jgi:hypothetical protein
MASAKTSLFPLPASQVVETLYVQLTNGKIVPRTPEEVLQLPADGSGGTVIQTTPPATSNK